VRVVDGDTVDVVDDARGRLRVRVIGIDTPEAKRPGYNPGCWGQEATEFAASTLLNQRVALIPDPTQDLHDRYGRTLSYIETSGGDFSVLAAAAGAGRAYVYDGDKPPQQASNIAAAEAAAREAGRGLWGPPCFGNTDSQPR
jgi:micrococcal nuclease